MNHRFNYQNEILKSNLNAKRIGGKVLQVLGFASALGMANPATAQTTYTFGAGEACPFPLRIDIVGTQPVYREFRDKNGNVVRFLSAGRGTTNTSTNLATGASITVKPNGGSVSRGTLSEDGALTTFVGTGFNGIISFPNDKPNGASDILYIGRVVYTIDADGIWTLIATSGKQTDICATLSPTP